VQAGTRGFVFAFVDSVSVNGMVVIGFNGDVDWEGAIEDIQSTMDLEIELQSDLKGELTYNWTLSQIEPTKLTIKLNFSDPLLVS